MANYRLHMGCNIPNTRFSVSLAEFQSFLNEFPELDSYSIIEVHGKFRGELEDSFRLEVFDTDYELVKKIAKTYKVKFRQLAVGIELIQTNYQEI